MKEKMKVVLREMQKSKNQIPENVLSISEDL